MEAAKQGDLERVKEVLETDDGLAGPERRVRRHSTMRQSMAIAGSYLKKVLTSTAETVSLALRRRGGRLNIFGKRAGTWRLSLTTSPTPFASAIRGGLVDF